MRTNQNKSNYPNYHCCKPNLINRLIWFPNQSITLIEALKICHNLPKRVKNLIKQTVIDSKIGLVRTNQNKENYPNCHSCKPNLMNRLIWFPNQSIPLREALKICQNLPKRVMNLKKTNGDQFSAWMSENQPKQTDVL